MAIQSTGGASQAGNTQDSGHFEDGLKGAQNSDLAKMAGPNSGLDATEKTAALKQLVSNLLEGKDSGKSDGADDSSGGLADIMKQLKKLLEGGAGKAGGADGAGDSGDSDDGGDDIMKLLKKLMSGGTLKPDEIKSVLSALSGNSDSSTADSGGGDSNDNSI